MINVTNIDVFNFEGAFRGLRNPLNSWDKSDSKLCSDYWRCEGCEFEKLDSSDDYPTWICTYPKGCKNKFVIGPKDLNLAQRMIAGGTDESKFLRQISVSMDIEAPLYWWKEFDTYKVGTVANSTSTMHKLATTPITEDCFSTDGVDLNMPILEDDATDIGWLWKDIIFYCEELRKKYALTKDKQYWRTLVQVLPNAWMQKRTITLNYQVLRAQYFARRNHKLSEWHEYCKMIEGLPYAKELICYEKER
ncbi:MAG: hypothetical protein LIR50_00475 [Bacillota bacterium]|nr:hypothetical protein [Bacillota bacterium]